MGIECLEDEHQKFEAVIGHTLVDYLSQELGTYFGLTLLLLLLQIRLQFRLQLVHVFLHFALELLDEDIGGFLGYLVFVFILGLVDQSGEDPLILHHLPLCLTHRLLVILLFL